MKQYVGIWIDTKQAVIIKLFDNEHSIKKIESHIDLKIKIPGEGKKFGRFGNQYLTYEKHRKNKRKDQTKQFINSLFSEIENFDSLVIFGPSKMKKKLKKALNSNNQFSSRIINIENSDLITDNQMVAWVKDYFNISKIQTTP